MLAHFIDELFITLPADRTLVKHLVLQARRLRLNLKVVPDLYDGLAWQAPLHTLGGFPLGKGWHIGRRRGRVKRAAREPSRLLDDRRHGSFPKLLARC